MISRLRGLGRLLVVSFLNTRVIPEAVAFIVILKTHFSDTIPFAEVHFVIVGLLGDLKVMMLVKVPGAVGIYARHQHIIGVPLGVVIFEEQLLLFYIELHGDGFLRAQLNSANFKEVAGFFVTGRDRDEDLRGLTILTGGEGKFTAARADGHG